MEFVIFISIIYTIFTLILMCKVWMQTVNIKKIKDKYIDGDIVNVYYYDKGNNKLDFVKDNLTVKDGYVEFEVEKGSDYLITMSNITSVNKKEINIFMIISIIGGLVKR